MNTHPRNRTKAISHTRLTTLVVDDSPFMLKILTQILKAAGDFDLVGSATNGGQALRYVSMLSPDLVLMDIHMPGLNGIQVTRSIKQSEHSPVVILASSDDSSVTKTTAEEAGADAFVSKEGNLRNQLMGALQDLFGPGSEKPEAVGISFQNKLAGYSKQEHGT
jgi:two-component system chemotaxis response regulator CheB